MLRDECVEVLPTWAQEEASIGYREIDRQLRSIAKKRAGLDVEEARWLREAERQRVWRKLGFSTALEYLEDVFGYAPRTAIERLRVAKDLGELPELEAEVRKGALPYSAAKELSRVMTRATEAAWLARARGKNLRDIEELVAGHKKGDVPDAPKDPSLIARKRTFDLPPHVDALLEQCRGVAADECGSHVDDAALIELLCRGYLAGPVTTNDKPTRPAYRIVIHKCQDCSRAWQEGRGRRIELRANERDRCECDAEVVDDRDDESAIDSGIADSGAADLGAADSGAADSSAADSGAGDAKTRAQPTVPLRIRNKVWARDEGRCRVPGCRATRNLDVHHIIRRADGGDHDPANLVVLCSGHHALHHDGLLAISGRAPDQLTFVRNGKPLVDSRSTEERSAAQALRNHTGEQRRNDRGTSRTLGRFDDVVKLEHAKQALQQLGYKSRAAGKALEEVCAHVGADADIPTLVRAVLVRDRNNDSTALDEDVFPLAKKALVQLGYPAAIATQAVEAARAHVGAHADLQAVIRHALRHCAKSK